MTFTPGRHLQRVLVAAVAVSVLLSGCPQSAGAARRASDPALITERDLPPGYHQVGSDAGNTVSSLASGHGLRGCPAASSRPAAHTTAAVFAKGPAGPYVATMVMRYAPGGAEAAIDAFDQVRKCHALTFPYQGLDIRFTVGTLPMRPMRDRTVSIQFRGRIDTVITLSVAGDVVAVRRGDLVLVTSEFAVGSQIDDSATRLAPVMVARCARLIRDC